MRGPILITGSHRSGTTWVGAIVGSSPEVGWIPEEPFNPYHRPGLCAARFPFWYAYISSGNSVRFKRHFERMFSFRYNVLAQLRETHSIGSIRPLTDDLGRLRSYRKRGLRPMLKDPLALFSAEWLAHTFNAQPVVLIRHPAAFASSLKRLEWRHDFDDFLSQPELIREYLTPFREELLERARGAPCDVVDEAILLWRLIYHTVARYQEQYPDWVFVRHEDLSSDPVRQFELLFDQLGLRFGAEMAPIIADFTGPQNPGEAPPECLHFLKRDSKSNIDNWRRRLTAEEIERIHRGVADIAPRYYSAADW